LLLLYFGQLIDDDDDDADDDDDNVLLIYCTWLLCKVSTIALGGACTASDICTDSLATCYAGVCQCLPGTTNNSNICGMPF